MYKKKIVIVALLGFWILILSTRAEAADSVVNVKLPTFPVTINGVPIDNNYSKYPLIVYKDITYFPMTYYGSRFLHMKANWYGNDTTSGILFVGYTNEVETNLPIELTDKKNKSNYTAVIPSYRIAVNTLIEKDFLDNSNEPYPAINFRGVTYFPLTWRFAVDEFGWEYSFTKDSGLIINSKEQFRPILDDAQYLSSTLPSKALSLKNYIYNKEKTEYVGYPNTNLGKSEFAYCEKGQAEKTVDLSQELADGEYYFNRQLDTLGNNNILLDIEVTLENGIITIKCVCINNTGEKNITMQIDMKKGKVISKE